MFCLGGFCPGGFWQGGFLSRGFLSGGLCPGVFCPGGFCPRTSAYLPFNVECLILADFPAQIKSLHWRFNWFKSFLEGLVIVLIYYYVRSSFEIQADIFMSFESIWWAFRRVKYRKTSKNISKKGT